MSLTGLDRTWMYRRDNASSAKDRHGPCGIGWDAMEASVRCTLWERTHSMDVSAGQVWKHVVYEF